MDREEERHAAESGLLKNKRKYVKMDVAFRDAVKKGSSKRWVYEDTNWPLK